MVENSLCVLCALGYVEGSIDFLLYNVLLPFFHSSFAFLLKKTSRLHTKWEPLEK
jgi:hypothetical protein